MQISVAALSLILLIACWSQIECGPGPVFSTTSCCFNFMKNHLTKRQVKSYYITSSLCPHSAVVFRTRKNFEMCARSEDKWVANLILQLGRNSN
ncbi:hypothetical protein GDO86_003825 [Hymenochirus boettgeri]|uniref:C-C motif chemokine n=1 Tax=Hymenochirus boettgeri TaxID=247094 RepID=A0A8T2KB18_9PIPI|nr:hypothetical protein GDO86_003825 [Hymenochirus boettgeri]